MPTSTRSRSRRGSPGDTVAVWGCGAVGLMAARSALLMGAERVIAIDRQPERLAMAREAIMACRKAGTLSVIGVYGLMDGFPLGQVINEGLTIRVPQQHGQRYMPRMFEHVLRGELDPSMLATHTMSLEEGPRGYELFKHEQDGCVRSVFAP